MKIFAALTEDNIILMIVAESENQALQLYYNEHGVSHKDPEIEEFGNYTGTKLNSFIVTPLPSNSGG